MGVEGGKQVGGVLMTGSKEPGIGPMKLVLMALGGCSAVDFVEILHKQRQEVVDVEIRVAGQRGSEMPRPYKAIQMTFIVR